MRALARRRNLRPDDVNVRAAAAHLDAWLARRRRRGPGEDKRGRLGLALLRDALAVARGRVAARARLILSPPAPLHSRQLARDLRARVKHVVGARDGVVDEEGLDGVARGGVRADGPDGLVAARAAL